jgi:hypothetical protein
LTNRNKSFNWLLAAAHVILVCLIFSCCLVVPSRILKLDKEKIMEAYYTGMNVSAWEQNSAWIITVPSVLAPIAYAFCYRGVGGRISKFVAKYGQAMNNIVTSGKSNTQVAIQ